MADKKYSDANGQTIILSPEAATQPLTLDKKYSDENGNPIGSPAPYKDPITKTTEKVAPYVGRAAAEALPFAGSFLGPEGTAAGYFAKTLLKSYYPDKFGEAPKDPLDMAVGLGGDLLTNSLLPKVASAAGKLALQTDMIGPQAMAATKLSNFPAVRNALVQRISQQAQRRVYPETQIIEQGAENAASRFADLEAAGNSAKLGDVFGSNDVAGMLLRMKKEASTFNGDIARTQTYKQISGTVLSDVTKVQNAKMTAGPEFTNDIAVNKLLTSATDPTGNTIDAERVLKTLGGKDAEIYKEAMNPASYKSLTEMMQRISEMQKQNITDTVLSFSNRRMLWNLAGGAGIGSLFGHAGIGTVAGGLAAEAPVITERVLRKIMSDPNTVQLVDLALRTPITSKQAPLVQKALTEILPRMMQGEADLLTVPSK